MIRIDKNNTTLKLVFSALMIAIAVVLSLFEFKGMWIYGGGVTFCSMLPLVIIAWVFGTKWGLLSSFVYAILQMVLGFSNVLYGSTFILMLLIALLDYIIAFTSIGLAAVFRNKFNNRMTEIGCGTVLALFLRFVCHFISGWAIWEALWPNELGMASPVYSLVYNGSYMLPEIVITTVVALILEKALHFSRWGEGSSSKSARV